MGTVEKRGEEQDDGDDFDDGGGDDGGGGGSAESDSEDGVVGSAFLHRMAWMSAFAPAASSAGAQRAMRTPREPLTSRIAGAWSAISLVWSMTCAPTRHSTTLPTRASVVKKDRLPTYTVFESFRASRFSSKVE